CRANCPRASRLIAKHVGSSLYTWTSVIGVVLAGITIGNYLGGYLADRFDRAKTLSWMFLASSLSCASILWIDQVITDLPKPDAMSWPMWVLCLVTMSFLLPALLIGTTSPLVASMALARSSRMGQTVGNVYAWGAFGSIVGTFITGFYLIDIWGTRSIVGLTSTVLALMAIAVAGPRWVFKTAVVCGWLQMLAILLVMATVTRPTGEAWAQRTATVWQLGRTSEIATESVNSWRVFGGEVGQKLHELGLIVELRDDQPGMYYDESSYSYIHVSDDNVEGTPVKALRLDKLIHAYYNPDEPTHLHYEYEQVYAAVTKQAAPKPVAEASATLPEFPGWEGLVENLPAGAEWEPTTRRLKVRDSSREVLDELRDRSPDASYWKALDYLYTETNKPRWGGFATASLAVLPEGITIPADLYQTVRYDRHLEVLTAYGPVTGELRDRLAGLSRHAPWRVALESLRKRSANVSALFLGGGGYIFPRWFLEEFPNAGRIEVAELDPAVLRAVKAEFGFTPADEERIHSTIGDARNTVDDLLRANRRRVAEGQPAELYDFIYGDAFNDFSIPWHLATVEFTRKLEALLTPTGVLQANIIDIYPRMEVPGESIGSATSDYDGEVPAKLLQSKPSDALPVLRNDLAPLQIKPGSLARYTLASTAVITPTDERRLVNAARDDLIWTATVRELASKTRGKQTLPMPLPGELKPASLSSDWIPCPEPFTGIEALRIDADRWVLGFRGAVSPERQQQLLKLRANDPEWTRLINAGAERSRKARGGRFIGRYVATLAAVFPCVYVFSTAQEQPTADRDTFVAVCSRQPLSMQDLAKTGLWQGKPFAWLETSAGETQAKQGGQMQALLTLAEGQILRDDFAPAENLMLPVFTTQD
ncbi:MAG TPA: fused MFS/spermidine synthase, partial [Planctomycetaceae bacterium]|nr:fused MFS/spermidine synthase [Planctomycetaceae bacterium]